MNNKTYDILRNVNMTVLPAAGAAYFSLSEIWGLPAGEAVVGTIAIIATFLGVILSVVRKAYFNSDAPYDGAIITTETDEGGLRYSLELGSDPADLIHRNAVTFKVPNPPAVVRDVTDTFSSD